MAGTLTVEDPEAYALAKQIAQHTGKTLTRVVVDALRRESQAFTADTRPIDMQAVRQILASFDSRSRIGERSTEEIMSDLYDENGTWPDGDR